MAQQIRKQKNRKKVKGVAIKKNNNPVAVRKVTKTYGGGVQVITYKKEEHND